MPFLAFLQCCCMAASSSHVLQTKCCVGEMICYKCIAIVATNISTLMEVKVLGTHAHVQVILPAYGRQAACCYVAS